MEVTTLQLIHGRGSHRSEKDSWDSIRLFHLYRTGVSTLVFLLTFLDTAPGSLEFSNKQYFFIVALVLLVINITLLPTTFFRLIPFRKLVSGMVLVDVLGFAFLMHTSNGLQSGLGLLIIPSVAGASLLLPGVIAYFFAALATLSVFAEVGNGILRDVYPIYSVTLAGIMGGIFFAVALLAARMARTAMASENLAKQRGRDLASLAQLNTHIIERMDAGILVTGDDGRIRLINQAAWQIFGVKIPAPPIRLAELSAGLYAGLSHWLIHQTSEDHVYKAENPGGSDFEARFATIGSGKNVATLIYLQDVSERSRQLQEMKLAALGRLTASIAHEIRNPLGSIAHASQLLQESKDLPAADQRLAQIVEKNTRRMNTLIENVLNLSRRKDPKPRSFKLYPWLKAVLKEYRQQHKLDDAQLAMTMPVSAQKITADPTHLHQVLWNLLQNSQAHAQPKKELLIEIDGGFSIEGKYAWIDIIDNGKSIDAHIVDKLFEPFFTTAPHGTGLGLFLARELCESIGGSLEYLFSVEEEGRFRIRLPLQIETQASPAEDPKPKPKPAPAPAPAHKKKTKSIQTVKEYAD
jgi:two-component system sensor histidine kinase PilS (NtrC family)